MSAPADRPDPHRPERLRFGSVEAQVMATRPQAVLLNCRGQQRWLPLSTLSLRSAEAVQAAEKGRTISVQIEHWKLAELDWPPAPGRTPGLFG